MLVVLRDADRCRTVVDAFDYYLCAAFLGWPYTEYPTHSVYDQPQPTEASTMRVAHAELGPWGADDPRFRDHLRYGLGIVLPVDRQAAQRPLGQAGSQARCAVHAVSRNSDAGPIERLRGMLKVFQRCDALEERMDGMAQWLGEKK